MRFRRKPVNWDEIMGILTLKSVNTIFLQNFSKGPIVYTPIRLTIFYLETKLRFRGSA